MRFADNRNKIGKYIPAVVFLIFIYGMALWFIFSPKPDYSSSEKRYLQKFPEVTAEKLLSGEFGSEFETFFADRFPQRNTWVGLNAYTALAEGNNGASGVYNCKTATLSTSLFRLRTISIRISVRLRILQINRHSDNGYARSVNRIYC